MATVTPTRTSRLEVGGDDSVAIYTWALTSANTDGLPIEWVQWADRCFTGTGTWGGATLTIQGSNDGSTWVTLNNAQGTAATATADKALQIVEVPRFVRPNLTTAGVGAAVTVILCARRAQPLHNR